MIHFACPQCGLSYNLPAYQRDRKTKCAACGAELVVTPLLGAPARPRKLWLLPVGAGLVGAVVLAGIFASRPPRPDPVRERFAAQLRALAGPWKGADWKTSDAEAGYYHVNVFVAGDGPTYTFEVTHVTVSDHTIIRVDPSPSPPHWLAQAKFSRGEPESFDYRGTDEREQEQLAWRARELEEAFRQAVR